MDLSDKAFSGIGELGSAIGIGLLAGLAGTAAITLSQMLEMKLTKRKPSTAPVKAVSKVFDIKPATEEDKSTLSQQIHWAYGISWGVVRGLISLTGLKGWPATAAHFAAIWGTAMIIQPKLAGSPPVKEWKPQTILTGGLHHAVYAVTAGAVYDAINDAEDGMWNIK